MPDSFLCRAISPALWRCALLYQTTKRATQRRAASRSAKGRLLTNATTALTLTAGLICYLCSRPFIDTSVYVSVHRFGNGVP